MSPINYEQLDHEANISTDDFYTKLDQESIKKPIGIKETLKHVDVIDVLEHIPVPFNPYQGAEKAGYLQAKGRLAEGQYEKYAQPKYEMTPMGGYTMVRPAINEIQDIAYVKQHEDWEREKATRGTTWGQSVTHGILDIFPWIADIAISGGVRKGATELISKAIKSPKLATGVSLLVNALIASSVQPGRFSETAATIEIEDPNLPKSEIYTKAVKRLYIENLSEMTGQYITKGALKLGRKVPFTNKLIEKTGTAWRKMFDKSADDFLKKISTATGVNDMFGEVGEERVNTLLQAITDADDFGAGKDAGVLERIQAGLKQDAAGLGIEIPVLIIPVAGRYAAAKIFATGDIPQDVKNNIVSGQTAINIKADPGLIPIQKQEGKNIIGNIRTYIINETVAKFPQKITDNKSLVEVGNAITTEFGIAQPSKWTFNKREGKRGIGANYTRSTNSIRVLKGTQPVKIVTGKDIKWAWEQLGWKTKIGDIIYPNGGLNVKTGQEYLKRVIIHELTHIAEAPIPGAYKRAVHHQAFKQWLQEAVRVLEPEVQEIVRPMTEISEITPGDETVGGTLIDDFNRTGATIKQLVYEPDTFHVTHEGETHVIKAKNMGVAIDEFMAILKAPTRPIVEKKQKPYKSQYIAGHEIPKILKMKEEERREFMEKETGETSMAKMTPSMAQDYIDALHKLARKKGIEVGVLPKERVFKKPIIGLTPQLYKAKILGVEFMTKPAEIGKQTLDLEFAKEAKQVNKMEQIINRLGGETRRTKAAAKLKNKPTKSIIRFAELLNEHEEPPAELSQEEKDVFMYFRNLNRSILVRENEVREELDMEPIPYKTGYMRHIVDVLAQDMMEGRHPIPEELKYWAEQYASKKIRNPMEFQRKLGDELEDIFSNDLIKATKAMLWTGLKEIHLNKPLKHFENQMGLHSEVIPDSTRRWAEKFINQMIIGKQTAIDQRLNDMVKESGIGKIFDKILRSFGRRVSNRPLTNLMGKAGRLQIYGVMGWRPKQLIRNKFQTLQNLALYTTKSNLKSFLPASKQLKGLMTDSLFLKTYKGFEDLREIDKRTLGKWWLAPFQWTAVSNAKRAMKVAYYDTLELIENPKYKKLGWADSERTYTEEREFLYSSEKEKLLTEMEFGAGVTQYHYIPMAMPGVFNYKAATPLTRLQSWWMNYFFKFHRESAHRFFKGETREGLKLPWSRRVGWGRYLIIGGLILNTLGYTSSYLFGAAPEAIPPLAQLLLNAYKYVIVDDDRVRASAKRRFLNALKTFIPGYLAKKDLSALLESDDWTKLLFYKKGIFAEPTTPTRRGRRRVRRVRPRKRVKARR